MNILLPLSRAMLCLDCRTLSDQWTCPHCGSQAVAPVATWLDRHEEAPA